MRRMHGPDPAKVEGATFQAASLARIWQFLRPYRTRLLLYLLVILATAAVGALPPLLIRYLINAIPHHRLHEVDLVAGAMVGVALATTFLSLVNRWYASSIGEGIIYDLRVALYDHV